MEKYKFRTLFADEIEVRIGQVIDKPNYKGVTLLLYKNARVDMDILDETVGADYWQREPVEVKGNLYCRVGIYNKELNAWVWKSDCGTESNAEKEKGESSDAFKRSCVNWGIGRELYTAPDIWYKGDLDEIKKYKFYVNHIAYDDKRRIIELEVRAKYKKDDMQIFVYCAEDGGVQYTNVTKPTAPAIKPEHDINSTSSNTASNTEKTMTIEQALNYTMKSGKNANKPFKTLPVGTLEWLAGNGFGTVKTAAKIVLDYVNSNSGEQLKIDKEKKKPELQEISDEELYGDDDIPF